MAPKAARSGALVWPWSWHRAGNRRLAAAMTGAPWERALLPKLGLAIMAVSAVVTVLGWFFFAVGMVQRFW